MSIMSINVGGHGNNVSDEFLTETFLEALDLVLDLARGRYTDADVEWDDGIEAALEIVQTFINRVRFVR